LHTINANKYSDTTSSPPQRNASNYDPLHTFVLPKGADRHYAQQFADMYFLRLAQLKKDVKAKAHEAWDDFEVRQLQMLQRHAG
jgi:DNA polymerase delta subunit 2